jgi:hypothetical protein
MITGIPIKIRGAMVTSSSVAYPGTGETAWANVTVYAVGDTRSYLIGDLYHKFECKLAHTSDTATGKIPEAYPDDETNAYWIDLGAVNKYAPFHLERNTQNDAPSPYVVSVDPGERVRHIAIGNIIADEVTLEIFDQASALVYTETQRLLVRITPTINDWIFAKHRQIKETLFSDLPTFTTHTFKLTFTRAAGNVRVGSIIPSVGFEIGSAQYGAGVQRENLSTINRRTTGEVRLKPRRNVPSTDLNLIIRKEEIDRIAQLIDDLNAAVTFWSGIVQRTDGYFESLFIIGICRDFKYSIEYPTHVAGSIKVEEL